MKAKKNAKAKESRLKAKDMAMGKTAKEENLKALEEPSMTHATFASNQDTSKHSAQSMRYCPRRSLTKGSGPNCQMTRCMFLTFWRIQWMPAFVATVYATNVIR